MLFDKLFKSLCCFPLEMFYKAFQGLFFFFYPLFDLAEKTCHFFYGSISEIVFAKVTVGYDFRNKRSYLALGLIFGLALFGYRLALLFFRMLDDDFFCQLLNLVPRNRSLSLKRKRIESFFFLKFIKTFLDRL